ncbi:hypothetical protein BKA65DRAFT_602240 [Rhexocercosporidium sp. MPI-PUGE-AT-0058]|nr:hypothetical protein BKA65DRAFT_602240 [Rhexocercosporidium sp. MPI-PUGE-AT-0058]
MKLTSILLLAPLLSLTSAKLCWNDDPGEHACYKGLTTAEEDIVRWIEPGEKFHVQCQIRGTQGRKILRRWIPKWKCYVLAPDTNYDCGVDLPTCSA